MKIILTITMLMIAGLSLAQSSMQIQYAGYLNASKTMWERSIVLAEKESGEKSFEKALAMYGLLGNTMASKDEETFDENVDKTIDLLKQIIEENPDHAEAHAVLSSVYGLVMAYSPMKGMILGMKSNSLIDNAMRLQPESALVQKLFAGSKLYTPEMFGGSPKKAVEAFKKAIELFELGETNENWMYMDSHMGLAMAYNKIKEKEKAAAILEKALSMEPQYHWAKATLSELKK